ncbi:hypothetical protein M409DRAFT_56585 [Zasmidium cellare ATCC 36951]|uniref:p-hydroxylaminobenzoate lyase n=1 Tax=Zasmidium cellare ATCC 36951 TaxID=1080233 RepID=A0A6A6CBY8_ZASCE|nr:uncharacterized protein M409DRAFT_56585 [Zasmidium cellare ATCC 36951]KAF2164303.1 hypothetical protein M409DRAFT_56585 [Zasmidium cellare ATCC 36951]
MAKTTKMLNNNENDIGQTTPQDPINVDSYPTAQKLVARTCEFLAGIQNLSPGKPLEEHLNTKYGPGTPYFDDFSTLLKQGFAEGWVATHELDRPRFRARKIMNPCSETLCFSLTAVYFDSIEIIAPKDSRHKHSYGEINCVIPVDEGFELEGLPVGEKWQGAGWTSLAAGTHHIPRARGGRGLVYFFLPSGRMVLSGDVEEEQAGNI